MPRKEQPDLFSPEEQAISKQGDQSGAFNKDLPESPDARDPSVLPADRARSAAKPVSDEQVLSAQETQEGVEDADLEQRQRAREEQGSPDEETRHAPNQ